MLSRKRALFPARSWSISLPIADVRAAVLYRTNSQSRVFEEAMRRASLAYNIVGGFSFYERMEVRDIIAYLKLAMNPHDSIALQRVINTPPRGIGKVTLDEIENRARELGISLGTQFQIWWKTRASHLGPAPLWRTFRKS